MVLAGLGNSVSSGSLFCSLYMLQLWHLTRKGSNKCKPLIKVLDSSDNLYHSSPEKFKAIWPKWVWHRSAVTGTSCLLITGFVPVFIACQWGNGGTERWSSMSETFLSRNEHEGQNRSTDRRGCAIETGYRCQDLLTLVLPLQRPPWDLPLVYCKEFYQTGLILWFFFFFVCFSLSLSLSLIGNGQVRNHTNAASVGAPSL